MYILPLSVTARRRGLWSRAGGQEAGGLNAPWFVIKRRMCAFVRLRRIVKRRTKNVGKHDRTKSR